MPHNRTPAWPLSLAFADPGGALHTSAGQGNCSSKIRVWNEGRLDVAEKFLDADLIQHNPNLPNGSAPLVDFIGSLRQQLPGLHFEIRRIVADNDHAVVHSLFTTGTPGQEQAVVDIFRIEHGRIVELWDAREEVPAQTASGNPIV